MRERKIHREIRWPLLYVKAHQDQYSYFTAQVREGKVISSYGQGVLRNMRRFNAILSKYTETKGLKYSQQQIQEAKQQYMDLSIRKHRFFKEKDCRRKEIIDLLNYIDKDRFKNKK